MSEEKADVHYVYAKDLPVCCPPPNVEVWSQHPRVYLAIGETGKVVCPYCSAQYILKNQD